MSGRITRTSILDSVFSGRGFLWLTAFCLLLAGICDQTKESFFHLNSIGSIVAFLGLSGILLFVIWRFPNDGCDRTETIVLCLMVIGFLLRLWYVLYTPVNVRQHDVFSFGREEPMTKFVNYRHAEYIEYICRYLQLPNADPLARGLSQLYHPPLHHTLAGVWLRLQTLLGSGYTRAVENIQLLTLLYSSGCMLLGGRLFRQLGLNGGALVLPMAIICLHPTFILLAGSVNNDILCLLLGLAAIVYAIEWYRAPSILTILPVALAMGGSMMTKLSGGLLAPGIAIVFLWRAGKDILADRTNWRCYFKQFVLFGVICVPMGLWWQVRHLLLYDVPLTYVPSLSNQSDQYIGDYSVWQRLFLMPTESLRNVFEAWKNSGAAYNEYNIPLALFKTAVFDEKTFFVAGGLGTVGLVASYVLFYSGAALALLALVTAVIAVWKKHLLADGPTTAMLGVSWILLIVSFVAFCFRFPHTCTQNVRYLLPTLVISAAFWGKGYGQLQTCGGKTARIARGGMIALTALFCVSAAVVYALLGFVE